MNRKLPCNALLVTVIISLLVFMLVSGVVLLTFYSNRNQILSSMEVLAVNNLTSAMNFVLSDTTFNNQASLPQNVLESVEIDRGVWGICQFATIRSVAGKYVQKKAFLYGTPLQLNACLYLTDHGRPLSLAGNTRLKGDVHIPGAGIIPGYVDQRAYDGATLAEGAIKTSGPQLPQINVQVIQQIMQQKKEGTSVIPLTLTQSFFSDAYIIHRKNTIVLTYEELTGRIIIQSDSAIVVGARCKLAKVILIAPRIEFRKGFSGNVQAFASREMVVEDDCRFSYPGCLTVQGGMQIGRNCDVNGMVIALSQQQPVEVAIQPGTIINGAVYVNGHTGLQGKVNGVVMTDFFVYRSASTEYENYLTDAEINRDGLSPWFVAPALFHPSTQRKIMQWLE